MSQTLEKNSSKNEIALYFSILGLNLLIVAIAFDRLGPDGKPLCGVVQVPGMLDRLVPVQNRQGHRAFAFLEDVISIFVDELFPGLKAVEVMPFRVTRNWDLEIDDEEAEDLLTFIQKELRKRDKGRAVRLEQGEVGRLAVKVWGKQRGILRASLERDSGADVANQRRLQLFVQLGDVLVGKG